MIDSALPETTEKMGKAVAHTQSEFSSVRTGRATPALVEKLKVDYYGTDVPLQQLAGFNVPEARLLVIQPYDKNALKAIERAIQNSDLGINPNNDGQLIRLVFPQLTEERRKDLVKVVKHKAEAGRAAGRRPEDAPRFGDVPPPPPGPRPPLRFPMPDADPSSVQKPPIAGAPPSTTPPGAGDPYVYESETEGYEPQTFEPEPYAP